jgi:hypothetical protein
MAFAPEPLTSIFETKRGFVARQSWAIPIMRRQQRSQLI